MDETYIKVKGQWMYLYRALDKFSATIDFLLRAKHDIKDAKISSRKQQDSMVRL